MSKIYVVVRCTYNDTELVSAWADEKEAIDFCDSLYFQNKPRGKYPTWRDAHNWHVYIEEVDFVGSVP